MNFNAASKFLVILSLTFFPLVCHPHQVLATVIEYTNRTDFENAIQGSTLFDFNSLPPGAANVLDPSSVSFGEATISIGTLSGIYSTDVFGAPTIQVGSLNGPPITIELNPGYTALGMDVGELSGPATFLFTLSDSSGIVFSSNRNVADNNDLGTVNTTFFGYVSDSNDIVSLELNGSGFELIDNLIYGNAIPIPEPTTLALAGLGLLGMGWCRRRRR